MKIPEGEVQVQTARQVQHLTFEYIILYFFNVIRVENFAYTVSKTFELVITVFT